MKQFLFYNKPLLALLMVLKFISSALMVGLALVLQYLVNRMMGGLDMSQFFTLIGLVVAYIGLIAIFYLTKDALSVHYINQAVERLRGKFAQKLLAMRYEDFSRKDSSLYISNLTNDMKLIATNYFNSLLTIPEEIFTFIVAVGVAFYIHYIVALTMLGLTLLIFIVPAVFNKPLNRANLALSESMGEFTRIIKQTFLGIDVVKNFSGEERFLQQIEQLNHEAAKKNTAIDRLNVFSMDLGMIIVAILQIGSIAVAGYFMLFGPLAIGAVLAVVQLGNSLFSPIMQVASKATLVTGMHTLNEEITKIFETPDIQDGAPIEFRERIVFDNVSYRYSEEDRNVLEGVNAVIEKGEKVLIVGRSGSGKSTLIKLFAKMFGGYTGAIYLDRQELGEISEKQLNQLISVAAQKSYLFDVSLRENIDFNGEGDTEKLNKAIETACLQNFIALQEQGIETVVNEEVNQISGGEKLRIGLARALYRDGEILLLDEVTSALDKDTAHQVEKNLLELSGKTLINISHKIHPDLLDGYDKIGIMEKGKIIAFDSARSVSQTPEFRKYLSAVAKAKKADGLSSEPV